MVGTFRPLLLRAARATAKTCFALSDTFFGPYVGPRLLIYHQIGSALGRQMEVTERAFHQHLAWLADNASVVGLDRAMASIGQPGADRLVVLTFDDGYEDLFRVGFPLLAARRLPFVLYLTTEPVETRRPLGPPEAIPLTWEQVQEMNASGLMTLGAHTHRHRDLRFLDRRELLADLATADELITRRLGRPPRHFAYPFGYWSAEADSEVRRRYVTAALGAGSPVTPSTDPFLIHRLPIQLSDGVFFFRRKLRSGLRLEEPVRRLVSGYRGP